MSDLAKVDESVIERITNKLGPVSKARKLLKHFLGGK